MPYLWIKLLHVVNASFLFGAGAGTAYFMLRGYLTARSMGDSGSPVLAATTRHVVQADWLFTVGSGVVQLVTGVLLTVQLQLSFLGGWILAALITFFAVFACWVPAAVLQSRILRLVAPSDSRTGIPEAVHRHMLLWTILGVPAFSGMLLLFYLMVFKPSF